MVQAVIVVPEGGDSGDGVKAPGVQIPDHLIHRGHADAAGNQSVRQGGAVVEGAVAALHVDENGGAGLDGFQKIPDLPQILLKIVNVDEVAVQTGQLVAQCHGVSAFVVVNGDAGVAHRGARHLADDIVGGKAGVQLGAVPGEHHIAFQKHHAAKPGDDKQQSQQRRNQSGKPEPPLGAIGQSHKLLLCFLGIICISLTQQMKKLEFGDSKGPLV